MRYCHTINATKTDDLSEQIKESDKKTEKLL